MFKLHTATVTGLLAAKAVAGGLNVPLPENNVFDYIVVGGGPAGLTVANRLSENANVQVLLLESGDADNYPESIMIPYYQGAAGSVNGKCGGFNWYVSVCIKAARHVTDEKTGVTKLLHKPISMAVAGLYRKARV